MRKISIIVLTLLFIACGKDQSDLTVIANIKGLKKGTVYLKKMQDTLLVTVDSILVNGNPKIELHSDLEEPEVYFLYLDKQSKDTDRIPFFADKGITEINTTLKNFAFDVDIKGSEQQKVMEEYKTLISKMNNRNLEVIKEQFEAQQANDTARFSKLRNEAKSSVKRKYLYTVNFALNNKDSEVAPYLALTEIYNARIDLLDTINKSLSSKVKSSKYGKELDNFILDIKAAEKSN
ncbi:DUF4369 domain-containing protein [Algibacter amylolyticus]|uniref:DUF4369 domain-containing protein n=1 Tax=Algibacter amylolyticus TaxID=1608400 RepID=A0A5M7B5D9_9FLAO|nr:DUF4369 domain-containing protein [Algibacter amylolyticus]KAA5824559.1 DUF4369 domain-containing protein [Algibacter amylolyticus]MBB5269373.1 succinate dehydrogenase flavin-adding protein (antitoxin of CptAB toxin-antitoxin module) [Algibacter amylolyticus]TSJ75332.1 DUF4369 domain-containing protein [Algibacter amylolyticus]